MLSPVELKDKQRKLRERFPDNLGLRVHRAISWLTRASEESKDPDVSFILLWVAFNSNYAEDIPDLAQSREKDLFEDYFSKILHLDKDGEIYNAIWSKFSGPIRLLLDNKYVFQPYWHYLNSVDGYDKWEDSFERSKYVIKKALSNKDTIKILSILFERLYVLRNQLVHGGSTWNSAVNREQVQGGKRILEFLLPCMIDIMMENPTEPWGRPYYPVVND